MTTRRFPPMNKTWKKRWVAALRSRKYEQTTQRLRSMQFENNYCCLGVLCDISKIGKWNAYRDYLVDGVPAISNLPETIRKLTGISEDAEERLAELNDSKSKSFKYIASYIDRVL